MQQHTKTAPKYQCEICGTLLGRKSDLNVHMRKQHSYHETSMKCRYCDEIFNDRWNLMQHQKTHRAGKTRSVVKQGQQGAGVKSEAPGSDDENQQQYIVTGSEGTQYMVYAADADSAREAVEAQHGGTAGQVVQLSSEEANAILANVEKDGENSNEQQNVKHEQHYQSEFQNSQNGDHGGIENLQTGQNEEYTENQDNTDQAKLGQEISQNIAAAF